MDVQSGCIPSGVSSGEKTPAGGKPLDLTRRIAEPLELVHAGLDFVAPT